MDQHDPLGWGQQEIPESLEGYFLISEAELTDPNFFRTVVLILQHNEDGAFGLVVNRQADADLSDALPEFDGTEAGQMPVYVGGPVEQQYLFVLRTPTTLVQSSENALTPVPGVTFEPATEPLMEYLRSEWEAMPESERLELRFYAGCAGWGPGQLEQELSHGAWIVHPATAEIVFHPEPQEGWEAALSKKGGLYRIIAQTGYKPSMN